MTCARKCKPCTAREGYLCHGDFYTNGEYEAIMNYFNIHGDTYLDKTDSVENLLDSNTIQIMKCLICDSEKFDYFTEMEIINVLDEIISRLSNDNNPLKKEDMRGFIQ